ncbi:MAG: DNA-binding domain-containing protein [Anaerovoracaceae bacterium]
MRFYIVDDVRSIVKVLDKIIEQKKLGEVIGFSTDAETAIAEIIAKMPDIVLVDLLMPVKDGITIVKEIRPLCPKVHFIMISQVSNKDMISEAYNAGIEFFIQKPINIIEVERVIQRVSRQVEMENTLSGLRTLLGESEEKRAPKTEREESENPQLRDIRYLLGMLGMLGERGTEDILAVCSRFLQNQDKNSGSEEKMIKAYCCDTGEDEKIVKQRMRRAAKKGLINMAHLGIEDSFNEIYQDYAQMVFDYENLRRQMDYLRGKSDIEGKVVINRFIEGLLLYAESRR